MIFDLIDYILGFVKMIIYKVVYLRKLKFDIIGKYSLKSEIRIFNDGKIKFGKKQLIRSGVKIRVFKSGKLITGYRSGFNNNCLINCMDRVEIGNNVILGQNVKIYDHDHIYKSINVPIRDAGFKSEPVKIGDNVWIGSDCIILKGSNIGANSVVGARTIINGMIPENSIIYNKREVVLKERSK